MDKNSRVNHGITNLDIKIAEKNGIKLRTLRSRVYKGVDVKLASILPCGIGLSKNLSDLLKTLENVGIDITSELLLKIKDSDFKYSDMKNYVERSKEIDSMFKKDFVLDSDRWIVVDITTGKKMTFKRVREIAEYFKVSKQAISLHYVNNSMFRDRYYFRKRCDK